MFFHVWFQVCDLVQNLWPRDSFSTSTAVGSTVTLRKGGVLSTVVKVRGLTVHPSKVRSSVGLPHPSLCVSDSHWEMEAKSLQRQSKLIVTQESVAAGEVGVGWLTIQKYSITITSVIKMCCRS